MVGVDGSVGGFQLCHLIFNKIELLFFFLRSHFFGYEPSYCTAGFRAVVRHFTPLPLSLPFPFSFSCQCRVLVRKGIGACTQKMPYGMISTVILKWIATQYLTIGRTIASRREVFYGFFTMHHSGINVCVHVCVCNVASYCQAGAQKPIQPNSIVQWKTLCFTLTTLSHFFSLLFLVHSCTLNLFHLEADNSICFVYWPLLSN